MAIGPKHEDILRVKAFPKILKRAVQEGMPLELLQNIQELALGGVEDAFRWGLAGKLPALVTTIRLRRKRVVHAA